MLITTIAAAMLALALASCAPIMENTNSGNDASVTITLPKLGSSSSIRALSEEQVSRLQSETVKFRITFKNNGMTTTRETTGGAVTAIFEIGSEVKITVECLNAKQQVIVRSIEKTITMKSGANSLSFKLSEDGEEITPENGDDGEDEDDGDDDDSGGEDNPPAPPPPVTEYVNITFEAGYYLSYATPTAGSTWQQMAGVNPPQGGDREVGAVVAETMNLNGYAFLGWVLKSDYDDNVPDTQTQLAKKVTKYPDTANTLVGIWSENAPNTHSVTFNMDASGVAQPTISTTSGTSGNNVAFAQGETVSFSWSGDRTGYVLTGWSASPTLSDLTQSANGWSFTMPDENVELTAQWREETYDITYTVANGEGTGTVPASFTINGGNVTLNDGTAGFARSGYRIASWKYDDGSTAGNAGSQVAAATLITKAGGSTSLQLTAVWEAIQYTITYDANGGGTNPGNTTFTVADSSVTFASSNTLSKDGYRFETWETTTGTDISNMTTPAELINLMSGGITFALRAKWEVNYKSDKANWEVGDIVLNNSSGTVVAVHPDVYTARDATTYGNGVAVVYKNDSATSKVYVVGKTHEKNGVAWCLSSAKGYNTNFTSLQCEPDSGGSAGSYTWTGNQNTDGSGNWQKLNNELAGNDDTGTAGNYPAWEFCNDYGKNNNLSGDFATDWYLPSIAELFDIWKANSTSSSAVETALEKSGDNKFDNSWYWSSSQTTSGGTYALRLNFGTGTLNNDTKAYGNDCVCAVRAFTY